jgi:hypothetical protein
MAAAEVLLVYTDEPPTIVTVETPDLPHVRMLVGSPIVEMIDLDALSGTPTAAMHASDPSKPENYPATFLVDATRTDGYMQYGVLRGPVAFITYSTDEDDADGDPLMVTPPSELVALANRMWRDHQ